MRDSGRGFAAANQATLFSPFVLGGASTPAAAERRARHAFKGPEEGVEGLQQRAGHEAQARRGAVAPRGGPDDDENSEQERERVANTKGAPSHSGLFSHQMLR